MGKPRFYKLVFWKGEPKMLRLQLCGNCQPVSKLFIAQASWVPSDPSRLELVDPKLEVSMVYIETSRSG